MVYCANCGHCVLFRMKNNEYAVDRVKCKKGNWKNRNNEKIYKYHTVDKRKFEECPDYASMGDDVQEFMQMLSASLPGSDTIYPLH